MKKITIILASAIALCSCNEDVLQIQDSTPQEYTIRLNPVGDISAHYSPLTKVGSTETTWYGINIKRDGNDYLFGLYDDITRFKVQLSTSHSYSFEVSAVKTDMQIVALGGTYSNKVTKINFPFNLSDKETDGNDGHTFSNNGWFSLNTDQYESMHDLLSMNFCNTLISGIYYRFYNKYYSRYDVTLFSNFSNLPSGNNSNEWYRFYGTKTNFTPSHDETLQFTMKHEGFGLQYNVNGICDGSVSVVIDNNLENDDKVTYFSQPAITGNFTSPQKVIEFRDMTAETEQVKVSVVWTRGNNVVDDLGSTIVNVRRNKVNKINITLGEHSNSKAMMVTTDASDYFGVENKEINI